MAGLLHIDRYQVTLRGLTPVVSGSWSAPRGKPVAVVWPVKKEGADQQTSPPGPAGSCATTNPRPLLALPKDPFLRMTANPKP